MTGILWLVPTAPIDIAPRFKNTKSPAVTLLYGVEQSDWISLIGLRASTIIWAECWNHEIQVLRVMLQNWLPRHTANPYVAISWADHSAPVRSNVMLNGQEGLDYWQLPYAEYQESIWAIEFLEWKSPAPVQRESKIVIEPIRVIR